MTTEADFRRRTARARRALAKQGYALHKGRAHSWNVNDQGGFRIVDADRNLIVAGERYDMTLEDVERYCSAPA